MRVYSGDSFIWGYHMTIEAVSLPPVPGHPMRWEIRGVNNMPSFTISETDLGDGLRALCNAFNSAQLRFELAAKDLNAALERDAIHVEAKLKEAIRRCEILEDQAAEYRQNAAFDQSRVLRSGAETSDLKARIYSQVLEGALTLEQADDIVSPRNDDE